MNLYNDASLAMIPSAVKDGKLYSIRPTDGSGDFTFSRGSNLAATRVNSSGLIEKGRENLLLQSNQFDTTWTTSQGTILGGQTGYDGSSDAWLYTDNVVATPKSHDVRQIVSESGVNCFSIYAKMGTKDWVKMYNGLNTCYFNIDPNYVGNRIGTDTTLGGSIEDVGSGWFRLSVFDNGSTSLVLFGIAGGDGVSNYTSDGTGTIYIQDAQLEVGLVATDYIETTTTTAVSGITEDLPRLDYSGGASCPSLLLEPQRTNLSANSEYLDALPNTGMTITTNATTSPEGVNNAVKIAYTSSTSYIAGGTSLTTGVDYTFSAFFKPDETNYVIINQGGASATNATYNFADGTHSGGAGITTDMIDYGNGWYRVVYTANLTFNSVRIYMSGNGSYGNYPAAGEGFFAYGFQLESNASYVSSYIPTYGSAVTRSSDVCYKTGVSNLVGQTDGTLFIEIKDFDWTQSALRLIGISDGTYNNRIIVLTGQTANTLRIIVTKDSVLQASVTSGNFSGNVKIAYAYSSVGSVLYANGSQVLTSGALDLPSTSNIYIGADESAGSGLQPNGSISSALLFKTRLTNAELADLTTL